MISGGDLIIIMVAICAAFVSCMAIIAGVLNSRVGDVVSRLDSMTARFDAKFTGIETRLDGIGNTLVRFDERLHQLEDHAS